MKKRTAIERMAEIARHIRKGTFKVRSFAADTETSTKTIMRDLDFMRDRLRHEIVFSDGLWSYAKLPECVLL